MKIAITADPDIPVPPRLYGGIERVIHMLIEELHRHGHDVTLYAHADSVASCRLVPYRDTATTLAATTRNMLRVSRDIWKWQPDVIHSFGRLATLLPLLPCRIPKLMTYQRAVTPTSVRWGTLMSRGTLHFSGISRWMMQETLHLGRWHLVFNGVPLATYDFVPAVAADAPFVFLGRVEHIKGVHLAIDIARRCGRKLIIAGNVPAGEEAYFEREVRPHADGLGVTCIGPVDDRQKNRLLGSAAAFLMPILWEEPFGIVMAEAMACGTPVLGLRRGAVPEVVEHGVTGFVATTVEELVEAAGRLHTIDRRACRERVERLFSATAVATAYLQVYHDMLAHGRSA